MSALDNAFRSTAGLPGAFALAQEPIIVGQTAYNTAYDTTFPTTYPNWGISRINDTSISFQRVDDTIVSNFAMKPKAIHDEMGGTFDDYGRMAAKLGLSVVPPSAATANFILQNYVDPPTEIVKPGEVQIWKITHNGVDAHPIHFHLFDVQILNRVAWDGDIRPTDPNELGWKDTVTDEPVAGHDRRVEVDQAQGAVRAPQQHPTLEPGHAPGLRRGVLANRPDGWRQPGTASDQSVFQLRSRVRVALPHPQP